MRRPGFACLRPVADRLAIVVVATVLAFAAGAQEIGPNPPPPADAPRVRIETTLGTFVIALYADKAPVSTANFLEYVRSGHYRDTIFHRVVAGFVVQGGGYTISGRERRIRPEIVNESRNGLLNRRGTVALARFANPDSAAAQFFVNLVDNAALDPPPDGFGYAVFGAVVEGMDVLDRIGQVPTGASGVFDAEAPLELVVIKDAVVLN